MADDEKAARAFLEGLTKRSAPWDPPRTAPAPRSSPKPSPKPAEKPRTTGDDAADQIEAIARRNREFAKRYK